MADWSEKANYLPLPQSNIAASLPQEPRRPLRVLFAIVGSIVLLLSLSAFIAEQSQDTSSRNEPHCLRGVHEGVSAKSNPPYLFSELSFNWTNAMFAWQRTAFHFQPEKNWMNDPDGPLYHMGYYHLFYQYNPDAATWGNISWGHAVSTDMIHWEYLPLAMVPDQWYDANGVWTGSATLLPDGRIVMLYTGSTVDSVQVQNLAYPANQSDPLLLDWVKYPENPVLFPPQGIEKKEFRDPSTAWVQPDGKWYLTIGSRHNDTGIALLYTTTNFTSYELVDTLLHRVPGTGMWECIDFYPVAVNGSNGLDGSVNGPGFKHVLKASLDDTKLDYYSIGTYDTVTNKWTPDNPKADVGLGLRYDYGWYYASKTFFDQNKQRRILWGWVNETDTETDDFGKGWASLQAIPRTILLDEKTGRDLLQWPVEEIESLRMNSTEFSDVLLAPGSVIPLDIGSATQLDVFASFVLQSANDSEEIGDCGGGSAERTTTGPFGILVLADDSRTEQTPIYFRPVNSSTFFCADETRSSAANDVLKVVYGTDVPVLGDESYDMRVLVDHSIVESFAQGGRRVITSRVYPTRAIYGSARLFLFNNATSLTVKATVKVWQLNSAFISPYQK